MSRPELSFPLLAPSPAPTPLPYPRSHDDYLYAREQYAEHTTPRPRPLVPSENQHQTPIVSRQSKNVQKERRVRLAAWQVQEPIKPTHPSSENPRARSRLSTFCQIPRSTEALHFTMRNSYITEEIATVLGASYAVDPLVKSTLQIHSNSLGSLAFLPSNHHKNPTLGRLTGGNRRRCLNTLGCGRNRVTDWISEPKTAKNRPKCLFFSVSTQVLA